MLIDLLLMIDVKILFIYCQSHPKYPTSDAKGYSLKYSGYFWGFVGLVEIMISQNYKVYFGNTMSEKK